MKYFVTTSVRASRTRLTKFRKSLPNIQFRTRGGEGLEVTSVILGGFVKVYIEKMYDRRLRFLFTFGYHKKIVRVSSILHFKIV